MQSESTAGYYSEADDHRAERGQYAAEQVHV